MLDSLSTFTFRVFVGVFGMAAVTMVNLLSSDSEGALQDFGSFDLFWEPPAPLSKDWPDLTTCSAVHTVEEREQGYARARSVLRAANLVNSRLREVSTYLQANSAGLLAVLPAVESLEAPFVQLRAALKISDLELRCLKNATGDVHIWELLEGLPRARSTSRSFLLELILATVRSSEQVQAAVVHSERETLVDSYAFKVSSTIQRLEKVAIAEVDESSDAHFDVGMLLSEVFVISRSRDTLTRAEELLRKGEELSAAPQRRFRALARAERLFEHGEVLATEWDLDREVAGSRYRNAVKIAVGQQMFQAGARYLASYANFLDGHGLWEEALSTAKKAVEFDKAEKEPLAQYLQVSLSQRLGKLHTPAQIRSAVAQLRTIMGKLAAWPEAETSGALLYEDLNKWHTVSEAGSSGSGLFGRIVDVGSACLQHGDAAKLTLCLLCKGILPASA